MGGWVGEWVGGWVGGRMHTHEHTPRQRLASLLSPQNEARLLREEVHRLTLELRERQLAISRLQAKHETLVAKGRGAEGGWGGSRCGGCGGWAGS